MTIGGAAATGTGLALRVAIRGWQLLAAPLLPPACRVPSAYLLPWAARTAIRRPAVPSVMK